MMRQWLKVSVPTATAFLLCLIVVVTAEAGSSPVAGARSAASREPVRSVKPQAVVEAVPVVFAEVTAAFTATPTTGSLGDAVASSRNTFELTEPIEFDAVLLRSGLSGTLANLQLFIFEQTSGRHITTLNINAVSAPDDRTGFFIQLDPGELPAGRLKWLMAIYNAFGETFITPLQAFEIQ